MNTWQNFYLQRMGMGAGNIPYPICESVNTWGIFCKEIPFKLSEKAKDPAKKSWYDEDGDDEFIPSSGLRMEAYEIKVSFGCKKMSSSESNKFDSSAVDDVRNKVASFISYLRTSGMMKMYSSYTRTGRQNVRLVSIDDNAKWKSVKNHVSSSSSDDGLDLQEEWLVFSVTFKVNDPVTDITL